MRWIRTSELLEYYKYECSRGFCGGTPTLTGFIAYVKRTIRRFQKDFGGIMIVGKKTWPKAYVFK